MTFKTRKYSSLFPDSKFNFLFSVFLFFTHDPIKKFKGKRGKRFKNIFVSENYQ